MLEAVPAFFALLAVVATARAWRIGPSSGRRRAAWLVRRRGRLRPRLLGQVPVRRRGPRDPRRLAPAVAVGRARPGRPGRPRWRRVAGGRHRRVVGPRCGGVRGARTRTSGPTRSAGSWLPSATTAATRRARPSRTPAGRCGSPWCGCRAPCRGIDAGTFLVTLDLLISALAIVGLRELWQRHRVYALWLAIALVFLFVWPTKWPQYVLVLSAPLCLSAGLGGGAAPPAVRARLRRGRRRGVDRRPPPSAAARLRELRVALPWLAPGIVGAGVLGVVPLVYEAMLSVTDLQLSSLRDGLRAASCARPWAASTGQIPAAPFDFEGAVERGQLRGRRPAGRSSRACRSAVAPPRRTSRSPSSGWSWPWWVPGLARDRRRPRAGATRGALGRNAWRTLFILPWAIPEVVGAVAWQDIFHPRRA